MRAKILLLLLAASLVFASVAAAVTVPRNFQFRWVWNKLDGGVDVAEFVLRCGLTQGGPYTLWEKIITDPAARTYSVTNALVSVIWCVAYARSKAGEKRSESGPSPEVKVEIVEIVIPNAPQEFGVEYSPSP